MNLFINAISKNGIVILFDNNRNIIAQESFELLWNESSKFIPTLDNFLKNNATNYDQLENLVCVNWPGSFTWVRTVVLAVNTINYIIWKRITPLSYFDLFENRPIIKASSKRDSFIQLEDNQEITTMQNKEIHEVLIDISKIYWENPAEIFADKEIIDNIDYPAIIGKIEFQSNKQIDALYIKKPNIS